MGGRQKQKHKPHKAHGGKRGTSASSGGKPAPPGPGPAHRAPTSSLTPLERQLQRLQEPGLTEEARQALEASLRGLLDDPWLVARSPALPGEHPLKQQASRVARALEQVTAGETGEAVLAPLAEVPRRSPLAPHVLAARAIHALYAGEREQAVRLAKGIDEHSPAAKLGRGVLALAGEPVRSHSKTLRRLLATAQGHQSERRLRAIDEAFDRSNPREVRRAVPELIRELQASHPHLVRGVRELVVRRWAEQGWEPGDIPQLLAVPVGSAPLLQALAIGLEKVTPGASAEFWTHYLNVAKLSEPDQALVMTHAAELVMKDPAFCPECGIIHRPSSRVARILDRLEARGRFDRNADLNELMGALFEAMGEDEDLLEDLEEDLLEVEGDALNPAALLEEAVELDPRPETFAMLAGYHERRRDRGELEATLEQWSEVDPEAVQPLVRLAELARVKGASRKAVAYIDRAAAIDALNPEVRLQKMRLLLNSALLRLKGGKVHLVRQDVQALRALEGTAERPRLALVRALEVLEAAVALNRNAPVPLEAVAEVTGDRTAAYLLLVDLCQLAGLTKLRPVLPPVLDRSESVRGLALGVLAYQPIRQTLALPGAGLEHVLTRLDVQLEPKDRLAFPIPDVVALADAAAQAGHPSLAIRITDEVLRSEEGGSLAQVLLHRGRALQARDMRRAVACLRAAFTLARRRGDSDTVRRAVQALQGPPDRRAHRHVPNPELLEPLNDEVLTTVLRAERHEAFLAETPGPMPAGKKRGGGGRGRAARGTEQGVLPIFRTGQEP